MKTSSLRWLISASITMLGAASLNACVTGRSSGGGGATRYRGAVTVTNQSGLRVCAVEPYVMGERHPTVATEIAPGASATFNAERDFNRVQVLECGSNRLLYGDPLAFLNERQMHAAPLAGRITLLPPGGTAAGGEGWSIPLDPVDVETAARRFGVACMSTRGVPDDYRFMDDADLAAQGLSLISAEATRAGWTERYSYARVVSRDWAPVQQRRVGAVGWSMVTVARRVTVMFGAHHGTGMCLVRGRDLQQGFDGESPTGPVQLGGIGPVYQIPCPLLDAMASLPGASGG